MFRKLGLMCIFAAIVMVPLGVALVLVVMMHHGFLSADREQYQQLLSVTLFNFKDWRSGAAWVFGLLWLLLCYKVHVQEPLEDFIDQFGLNPLHW